jgi:hypothetical protein
VLCTKMEIFIELVKFNKKLWENVANKLNIFFNSIFLPEIVYPKVKYGLAAIVRHGNFLSVVIRSNSQVDIEFLNSTINSSLEIVATLSTDAPK